MYLTPNVMVLWRLTSIDLLYRAKELGGLDFLSMLLHSLKTLLPRLWEEAVWHPVLVKIVEDIRETFIGKESVMECLQNLDLDLLVQLSSLFVFAGEVLQDSENACHGDPYIIAPQKGSSFGRLNLRHRATHEILVDVCFAICRLDPENREQLRHNHQTLPVKPVEARI